MSILVENEPEEMRQFWLEHCCFCREKTSSWTVNDDRSNSVACCKKCAEVYDPKDVPSKKYWCEKERQIYEILDPYCRRKYKQPKKQDVSNVSIKNKHVTTTNRRTVLPTSIIKDFKLMEDISLIKENMLSMREDINLMKNDK